MGDAACEFLTEWFKIGDERSVGLTLMKKNRQPEFGREFKLCTKGQSLVFACRKVAMEIETAFTDRNNGVVAGQPGERRCGRWIEGVRVMRVYACGREAPRRILAAQFDGPGTGCDVRSGDDQAPYTGFPGSGDDLGAIWIEAVMRQIEANID
jgi:hypothetical protein